MVAYMKYVGITVGDINGIGPEVAVKAIGRYRWPADVRFVLIGSEAGIRRQVKAMGIPLSRRIEFMDVGTAP